MLELFQKWSWSQLLFSITKFCMCVCVCVLPGLSVQQLSCVPLPSGRLTHWSSSPVYRWCLSELICSCTTTDISYVLLLLLLLLLWLNVIDNARHPVWHCGLGLGLSGINLASWGPLIFEGCADPVAGWQKLNFSRKNHAVLIKRAKCAKELDRNQIITEFCFCL